MEIVFTIFSFFIMISGMSGGIWRPDSPLQDADSSRKAFPYSQYRDGFDGTDT